MAESTATRRVETSGYRLWSRVYDSQPNPMLSLEQRYLRELLPGLAGKDIVDLGCGTGRWLAYCATEGSRSLTGVDVSAEMLDVAARKLPAKCRLVRADCNSSQLPSSSADLIIASFVFGYVLDPGRFVEELHRIGRDNCDIFLTDLHPATAQQLGWSRGFRLDNTGFNVPARNWSLDYVTFLCDRAGLEVVTAIEPCFASPEHEILSTAGKLEVIEQSKNRPAIYILHLRPRRPHLVVTDRRHSSISAIRGAQVVIGPTEQADAAIAIADARVTALGNPRLCRASSLTGTSLDLEGYTVFPGLINSHDHLEFALFPRMKSQSYSNALEWYEDVHTNYASTIDRHRRISKSTRLWWGGLRNLLSGVTTVCHHNPVTDELLDDAFPVRVVRDFGWAHSIPLDDEFSTKHQQTPSTRPFIVHIAEGRDTRAAAELHELNRAGALDQRTVLVHALAVSDVAAELINSSGASLVWCPSSNVFLFGHTHTGSTISRFNRVALGTDSSLTARGDLLDEIRLATTELGASTDRVFQHVTSNASSALRLENGEGAIRVGGLADFAVFRTRDLRPADALASYTWRDVQMVIEGGVVFLASPEMLHKLPLESVAGLRPLLIDDVLRWVRAPLARMFSETADALGCETLLNGRRLRHATTAWI